MTSFPEIIGALIPTILLSRLMLWLMRSWDGGYLRILLAHLFSLLVATSIMTMTTGSSLEAFSTYAPAQAVWLLVDLLRRGAGKPEVLKTGLQQD